MNIEIVSGDLLDQDVDAIVNAWNRNLLPWWLLVPQGVSRAIRKRVGSGPFRELRRCGLIPLGGAVTTSGGNSNFKGIVHVAGINLLWRASELSIRRSVRNALQQAKEHGFHSMAFPVIGSGTGAFNEGMALAMMLQELEEVDGDVDVKIVRYRRD